jgi:hypothetical protein
MVTILANAFVSMFSARFLDTELNSFTPMLQRPSGLDLCAA